MNLFERKYAKKHREWQRFEHKLQLADIILVRTKKSLIAKIIQKITGSYWDHVALVFMVPNKKLSFYNYLVIEVNRKGLEVHRIQEYTENFRNYDIGVKRIMGLDDATKKKVLSFMLNQVDKPYDMPRILGFLLRSFDVNILKNFSHLFVDKQDFICSTFIQEAFLKALPQDQQDKAMFVKLKNKRDNKNTDNDDLLNYVSPADVAKSANAKWLYNERD
ncbi:MAG TPA: YiiX/YebB-like N1pC/P60 family cysteine hydrolase [bacterium]|nr:YiiX/YebB-like N1pC/P60 family cysteine hydrolase [bacterium]